MLRQRTIKTITGTYNIVDIDCGTTIRCNSETAFTITLPDASLRINFDFLLINVGSGSVTCGSQIINQYSHAHVTCDGSVWAVAIGGGGLTLGETSTTAYRGDMGKTAYDHSQSTHAPTDAQKNSDITKTEIEAKLTGEISSHNHAGSGTVYYEPLVNGDSENPEIMFDDDGDIIMVEV